MSVLVRVPTPLRAVTKGQGELKAEAGTIKELIDRLDQEYAGIKGRLCEEDGNIRRFINIYVNEEDIRFLQGPATPLKPGDEVSIVPAIAGGTGNGRGVPAIAGGREHWAELFVKSLRASERPPHPVPLPRWGEGIKKSAPLP